MEIGSLVLHSAEHVLLIGHVRERPRKRERMPLRGFPFEHIAVRWIAGVSLSR